MENLGISTCTMDKQSFNNLLGGFIRRKREEKKLTQSQLASRVGNNSAIERGKVSPTMFWCSEILAPALHMTSAEFFTEFDKHRQNY
ncbi:helix-turn-helix domain-containing protein [Sinomicrobium oceani]|uniref:helix-turn-helix domain-containing protein n=1 Tax=Sinomicrobium oceani TaxID=1150368 RepID=UPI00227CAD0F|nr:helix-turn-helix transcriptional regulator [Sinomicrobium oceani]